MASDFDAFARNFAAPMLLEVFGERDDFGSLTTISYLPPGQFKTFSWPAIIGRVRFVEEFDPDREALQRRELVEIVVERDKMRADGVEGFQKNARVEALGKVWSLDESATRFDDVFATLGLVAIPLTELGARRSAAV